ncbi:LysR family transcriptional regulator, partial [Corallococcus exiguus]|uniref:LysR family transcriptional regulator n=1 Tax=Corallococcus exiguus TaxID=83462 RepID=UPI001B8D270A
IGTVTAAAQSLRISQPTVSTILRRMEDQLRIPLFRTNRGRLIPTNEARILYESLQRSFEQLQSINGTIETLRHGASHRISIATIQPLANSLVAHALAGFLAEMPQARVHLLIRPRKEVLHAVAMEGVDIGITFRTGEAEGLRAEQLSSGKVYC